MTTSDLSGNPPEADKARKPLPPSFLEGLKRGIARHCPTCGRGRLFDGYLAVRPVCAVCGNDNERYPSDDVPPYFTILIVGHLVLGPTLALGYIQIWPLWQSMTVFPILILIVTLVLLPFIKGAVIGAEAALGLVRAPDRPLSVRIDPEAGEER